MWLDDGAPGPGSGLPGPRAVRPTRTASRPSSPRPRRPRESEPERLAGPAVTGTRCPVTRCLAPCFPLSLPVVRTMYEVSDTSFFSSSLTRCRSREVPGTRVTVQAPFLRMGSAAASRRKPHAPSPCRPPVAVCCAGPAAPRWPQLFSAPRPRRQRRVARIDRRAEPHRHRQVRRGDGAGHRDGEGHLGVASSTLCADQAGVGDPAQARSAIDACISSGRASWARRTPSGGLHRGPSRAARRQVVRARRALGQHATSARGRTRWKGPDGVVGRDGASGGLALSQQWEVLCPGRVSASCSPRPRALGPPTAPAERVAQVAAGVGLRRRPVVHRGEPFAMSVVEFRASLQGTGRCSPSPLRFRNKLNRPLVLGYVQGSGGATDDRGNRYVVKDGEVRGIGLITRPAGRQVRRRPGSDGRCALHAGLGRPAALRQHLRLSTSRSGRSSRPAMARARSARSIRCKIVGLVDGAAGARRGPVVAQAAPGTALCRRAVRGGAPPPSTSDARRRPAERGRADGVPPLRSALPTRAERAVPAAQPGTSCHDAGAFTRHRDAEPRPQRAGRTRSCGSASG